MRILVTGADGFVGSRLVPRLTDLGHKVGAAVLAEAPALEFRRPAVSLRGALVLELDLRDSESVLAAVGRGWDAVVHLAAVASGSEASRNPTLAWEVNAVGTVRLIEALSALRRGGEDPLFLFVSTAEVYGVGDPVARVETDAAEPCSPYAASKLAAEIAVIEASRRTGLRAVIARPFPHTGAGQDARFVVPAFAERVLEARRLGSPRIRVGNLDPVRDFLHVEDVLDAYISLLEAGRSGEIYNIASGKGVSVKDLFSLVAEAVGYQVEPEVDRDLVRAVDVPHLVGSSEKLRRATGWQPKLTVEQAVREVVEVVDAKAD